MSEELEYDTKQDGTCRIAVLLFDNNVACYAGIALMEMSEYFLRHCWCSVDIYNGRNQFHPIKQMEKLGIHLLRFSLQRKAVTVFTRPALLQLHHLYSTKAVSGLSSNFLRIS